LVFGASKLKSSRTVIALSLALYVKAEIRANALTYKAKENAITVLEDFNFEAPKTKNFIDLIKNLNLTDKKTLLVLGSANKNIYLSSRNLQGAKVINASDLNTYDILHAENLILAESSVKVIETILNK
jgi:large subunit ribosomal protein L4